MDISLPWGRRPRGRGRRAKGMRENVGKRVLEGGGGEGVKEDNVG